MVKILDGVYTGWIQKHRILPLSTIIRHCANKIEALEDKEGSWFREVSAVKGMVRDFFVNLSKEPSLPCTTLYSTKECSYLFILIILHASLSHS